MCWIKVRVEKKSKGPAHTSAHTLSSFFLPRGCHSERSGLPPSPRDHLSNLEADAAQSSPREEGGFSSFFCGFTVRRGGRGLCSVETLLTCLPTPLIIFSCLDGDETAGISPWKITSMLSLSFLGKWPPGC